MQTKYIANRTSSIPDDPTDDAPRPIVAMAKTFPTGHVIEYHQHQRSQFLYASSGVMTVATAMGVWVVPPSRAVWIPARTAHQIAVSGHLSMRTLYLAPDFFSGPSDHCCVVSVTPLLKELLLQATRLPRLYPLGGPEERLLAVILDQIHIMTVDPLELKLPADERLRKICDHLAKHPGSQLTLSKWGKKVGATARTLSRHFRRETGMSFVQWRQQIRILEALKRLAINEPVTTVALELGYDSPSAFIAMFKKALGKTPRHYFSNQ